MKNVSKIVFVFTSLIKTISAVRKNKKGQKTFNYYIPTKIFAIVYWNERTQLPEQTTVQDSLSEIEK